MPLTPEKAVDLYIKAWNEADPAKRMDILAVVWSEDGTFQDPSGKTQGRNALAEHIGAFQTNYPGARLELGAVPNSYDGHVLFSWTIALGGGAALAGYDYGNFDEAGRFRQIVGFFKS